ncbi:hypothetical protein [Streptomyces sp. NPDC057718]|uniref:hypothetical protein n=1 Tax=Streptomyces sp. NPDC057718 TaxID=3346225 RepID=UPI00369ECDA9
MINDLGVPAATGRITAIRRHMLEMPAPNLRMPSAVITSSQLALPLRQVGSRADICQQFPGWHHDQMRLPVGATLWAYTVFNELQTIVLVPVHETVDALTCTIWDAVAQVAHWGHAIGMTGSDLSMNSGVSFAFGIALLVVTIWTAMPSTRPDVQDSGGTLCGWSHTILRAGIRG